VRDHLPPIEGAEKAVTQSVLRVCPICDGFEAIDQRIAIIGDGAMAEREAEFLRNYSYRVTVLDIGPSSGIRKPPPTGTGRFERININLSQLEIKENRVTLASATGERYFDVAYLALGSTPQHGLARSLGAQCDERDALTGGRVLFVRKVAVSLLHRTSARPKLLIRRAAQRSARLEIGTCRGS
jgi:thioredoxin reductase (NADPH)